MLSTSYHYIKYLEVMNDMLRESDITFIVLRSSKIKCVDVSKRLYTCFVFGINLINSYHCNDMRMALRIYLSKEATF